VADRGDLEPPDRRAVRELVPPRDAQRSAGWWTVFSDLDELTLENYETVLEASATASPRRLTAQLVRDRDPGHDHPDRHGRLRGLRVRVDRLQGAQVAVHLTVSLLAIPLQVALIPLLQLYVGGAHITLPFLDKTITLIPDFDLAGTTTAVWLTHAGFALPFAIFLLHNYISQLPKDLFEAARIDGADHFTVFWRLVLPLSIPVLAAFGIFQFLWTWNDFLIANTMAGANPDAIPTTIRIANLAGDFGRNEHLLPAAAFTQAFVPIVVFFALQRYFVRGLLAGSVKG
jgi:alpha-glucoside transport system permease protein